MKYKNHKIERRRDGRWQARFTRNGQRIYVYARTQAECLKKLKTALNEKTTAQQLRSGTLTVRQWFDRWIELYKINKVAPATIEQYRYNQKGMAPILDKPICKVTSIELQELFNGISQHRKREQIYYHLKDAFTKAFKNKIIKENPFDIVEIKREKKKATKALTRAQEEVFVEACRTYPQGSLYLLCLYQGLRLGEAMALTMEDIDFDKRTITIDKQVLRDGTVAPPKTECSARIIPLFARTIEILPKKENGRLFDVFKRSYYQKRMRELTQQLGLADITIHSMRHTFATRCAETNISPKVTQKWMGHSTIQITLDIYTHVNSDFEHWEMMKFDTKIDTIW